MTTFDNLLIFYVLYLSPRALKYVWEEDVEMNKIGTVTVSVFQSINKNNTAFKVETDYLDNISNDDVEQVSYVIEDTLNSF